MKTSNLKDQTPTSKAKLIEILDRHIDNDKSGFAPKHLYDQYNKLSNFNDKVTYINSLINNKEPESSAKLEKLTHYIANRIQLSSRIPVLERQTTYTHYSRMQKEEFGTTENLLTIPTISGTVLDTIKNAANHNIKLDTLLNNLKEICIELIFTEHPTDPLSEEANRALSNINNNVTTKNLENYIGKLWDKPLTPTQKRSVMEEAERDLVMLKRVFTVYPEFIKRVKEAITIYYPKASPNQFNFLDDIMAAKLGNKFLQGGGWAGFDADGNDEVRPDRTFYTLLKRRITSMEQYTHYIESNILPHFNFKNDLLLIADYNDLINLIKTKQQKLEQQIKKLEPYIHNIEDCALHFSSVSKIEHESIAYYLTSEFLLDILNTLQNKYDNFHDHKPYQEALHILTGLINNFGMGAGRADVRQKSYTNLRVITVILEDLKCDNELADSIIFTQFLNNKTFVDLEEKQKICLLEKLLDNSEESEPILNKIKEKFNNGYYLDLNDNSYTSLKNNSYFPKDGKIPLNQEVHRELWRNHISCHNDTIIQKSIISNTEHCSDLFIQDFLRNIFDTNSKIITMPLIESMKDLEESEGIIHEYILYKIENFFIKTINTEINENQTSKLQELLSLSDVSKIKSMLHKGPDHFLKLRKTRPELDQYMKQVTIETMVGFSDSERESGTSALYSLDKSIELQRNIAAKYGIKYRYFGGAGGDIERGGESRNCQEQTFQGNVKRNLASTNDDLLYKLEKQFSAGYNELLPKEIFEDRINNLSERYKDLSSKAYEFLYDIENGYGKLTAVLYGIGVHNTIVDASNFSSRATILGSKSNVSFMPLSKLRAITKVQDDELSRNYLGLNVGPDAAMEGLGTENFIDLYLHSPTQRDIIAKTAIGIALTNWSIAWLNFPQELRPYNSNGEIDKEQLAKMSAESIQDLKLLKDLNVEDIITKQNYNDPEYKQVISMVANLNARLHANNIEFSNNLFNVLKKIYPGPQTPKTFKKSTDILFFMPELKQYYESLLCEIEPISILANLTNLNVQIYAKKKSELFDDNSSKIIGNIAAASEASRADPVYHLDPIYYDPQKTLFTPGVLRMKDCKIKANFTDSQKVHLENILKQRNENTLESQLTLSR